MALISFGYRIDMFAIDPPEVGSYIVAYDLDGVLKQKDHLGVVTLVGAGAGGPQGPPGPVGPAGLTWSGYWVATQSYSLNYAVGYASASWWCISPITGSPSNPSPDVDTTHWTLLAAQGSPGSQGGTGSQGLQGPQGEIGLNWIGDWIINVYDVRDAVYYNGSSYVCIASTVGTETLAPDTNTACWKPLALKGDVGPQGATGSPGVSGATGSTLQDIFYNIGGTVSATNSTTAIYRTGSLNIGTGTASDSRFVVSSSGGTTSLVVGENGAVSIGGVLSSLPLKVYGSAQVTSFFYTNVTEVSTAIIFDGAGYNGIKKNTGLDFFTYGTSSTIRFTNNSYGISSGETTMLVDTTKKYVGIGTDGPSASLHIYSTQSGALRLEDGTQGSGKVLVSDTNGVATWTPLSTIGISGSASYIPKFTGTSSLGNSRFVDNGSSGSYNGTNSDSVTFIPGANVFLRLLRSQSSMDFTLGNPTGQTGIITSYNTLGLDIMSQGYLALSSGPSFSEAMRISSNGAVSIGTGTASNSRFVVSSSGGTTSFYVNEAGDSVFRGDTKIIGATISGASTLPPGSITFGTKTAIYPPGDNEIVIGTDTLFRYGWKFTGYQITNLWGNTIEFQNSMGTIGNLFVGSNYTFAGFNPFVNTQQSTLFVKGTTASIMRVVGIGATWSNSQSIFEINNNGAVSIGTSQSMSGTELFIQSNTASTTIGSNVMLDLYNGQSTGVPNQVSELAFSADSAGNDPYNIQHRYAVISGYATTWNNLTTGGGIKFSTRESTVSTLTEKMTISPVGNVGIGTTSPSTKLHVFATQSGALRLQDGTQANGYILTSDTNGVASWTASFVLGVIATSSNITTDTLDINGLSQRGRCIIIDNGTYSINLTVNGATGFTSTYLKHGTASVTFVQGSGRTLVQVDGTAVLNGVAGSTATLLSYGTTDYLRINNA